jgi:hypothetical protein
LRNMICSVKLWYNEPYVYSECRSDQDKPPVSKCGYRLLFGEIGVSSCLSNAHNRQLFADFSPTEHLHYTR